MNSLGIKLTAVVFVFAVSLSGCVDHVTRADNAEEDLKEAGCEFKTEGAGEDDIEVNGYFLDCDELRIENGVLSEEDEEKGKEMREKLEDYAFAVDEMYESEQVPADRETEFESKRAVAKLNVAALDVLID